ncbi:hypothetical protein [Nitrincola sp. A-D6]|nr:hypothetical protein [Nitrincola sp. A-D6]
MKMQHLFNKGKLTVGIALGSTLFMAGARFRQPLGRALRAPR